MNAVAAPFRPFLDVFWEFYLRWAMSEIDPMHDDVRALAIELADANKQVARSRVALFFRTFLSIATRPVRRVWTALFRR